MVRAGQGPSCRVTNMTGGRLGKSLKSRVAAAAAEALARQGFVTPVDVCLGLGWLHASHVADWRHGRVDEIGRAHV